MHQIMCRRGKGILPERFDRRGREHPDAAAYCTGREPTGGLRDGRGYRPSARQPRRPLPGSMMTRPPGVCRLCISRTDRDGAALRRTHMTPTGIEAVFRSSNPNPAFVRSVAKSPSGPGPPVRHRHRPSPVQVIRTRLRRAATATVGPPSAGSSKAGNASPPPSDATTDAPRMCVRRPGPKRPNRPSATPRASITHPGGPEDRRPDRPKAHGCRAV